MRAMTGVRTILPLSLSLSLSLVPPLPLYPSSHLPILHMFPSIPCCLSLSPFLPSSLLSIFLSSSLSGITLVDETSPVDEPSNSDQVTEGVKFAYTLPQQQSNREDNDTVLVCVHHARTCALCIYICVCTLYVCMYVCMYVCTYVCKYVCMYVCMYVCTYV